MGAGAVDGYAVNIDGAAAVHLGVRCHHAFLKSAGRCYSFKGRTRLVDEADRRVFPHFTELVGLGFVLKVARVL